MSAGDGRYLLPAGLADAAQSARVASGLEAATERALTIAEATFADPDLNPWAALESICQILGSAARPGTGRGA